MNFWSQKDTTLVSFIYALLGVFVCITWNVVCSVFLVEIMLTCQSVAGWIWIVSLRESGLLVRGFNRRDIARAVRGSGPVA